MKTDKHMHEEYDRRLFHLLASWRLPDNSPEREHNVNELAKTIDDIYLEGYTVQFLHNCQGLCGFFYQPLTPEQMEAMKKQKKEQS